jgi:hypothetical protein
MWTQQGDARWERADGLIVDVERAGTRLVLYVSRSGVGVDRELHEVVSRFLGDASPADAKKLWRAVREAVRTGAADLTRCRASVVFTAPTPVAMDKLVTEVVSAARIVLDEKLPVPAGGSDV